MHPSWYRSLVAQVKVCGVGNVGWGTGGVYDQFSFVSRIRFLIAAFTCLMAV